MTALLTGEPRFDRPHAACMMEVATITDLLNEIALLNDPLTFSGGGGVKATNGPESSEPGRQQAPGAVRKAESAMNDLHRDLCRAKKRLINAWAGAKVHEAHDKPAQSMGGHEVGYTETGGSAYKPHKRKALETHLAKKLSE